MQDKKRIHPVTLHSGQSITTPHPPARIVVSTTLFSPAVGRAF
jgi:hypothetical protein